jgi:hypothetical protein
MDTLTQIIRRARQGQSNEEAADAFWAEFEGLIRVFGETVPVIVACWLGSKVPRYTWKKGVTDKLDDYRLNVIREAFVEGGNLAALLGKESHNLCVIDFDRNDLVEPFLALNPAFASTFRTRGSKGAAFWFFAENEHYPNQVKRFEIDGDSAGTGEFRGAELATFFGLNKAREEYQWLVDAPVIRFDYSAINWPPNWRFVTARERVKATDADGNPIERKPFSGKPGEVDWDSIRELTENNDGDICDGLVAKYWPEAKWDGREWRCANIGGDKRRNRGSFYLTTDGFAGDFDGSYPRTTIITAIFSKERLAATGEKVTLRDFLDTIKTATGIDFSPKKRPFSNPGRGYRKRFGRRRTKC